MKTYEVTLWYVDPPTFTCTVEAATVAEAKRKARAKAAESGHGLWIKRITWRKLETRE